jgi:putative phosphoribosyl transferase
LTGSILQSVRAPTLLIVGALDTPLIEPSRRAFGELACEKRIEIVPGTTHPFEDPSALNSTAELAHEWFERHLSQSRAERAAS